jgi:hypothetical protein
VRQGHGRSRRARPSNSGIGAAWNLIARYVSEVENTVDANGVLRLPNQSSRSMDNLRPRLGDTHPREIETKAAIRALKHLPADKTDSYRNATRFLDKLIAARDAHAPIGQLPTMRDAARDWSRFASAFIASRDRAIAQGIQGQPRPDRFGGRLGNDPIADRRAAARGRKRPVRNKEARQKRFTRALSWLARHAFETRSAGYALASVEDLVTEDNVLAAVARFKARADASDHLKAVQSTTSLSTWLADLDTLALRNGLDEEVVWAIEDARFDPGTCSDHTNEMSATRADFVKLVERDPAVVRAIVNGPRKLQPAAGSAACACPAAGSAGSLDPARTCRLCANAAMRSCALVHGRRPKLRKSSSQDKTPASLVQKSSIAWRTVSLSICGNSARRVASAMLSGQGSSSWTFQESRSAARARHQVADPTTQAPLSSGLP